MTDLTTLAYVLKTGVAGPEAQAAAAAEITRLRDQVETLRSALSGAALDQIEAYRIIKASGARSHAESARAFEAHYEPIGEALEATE